MSEKEDEQKPAPPGAKHFSNASWMAGLPVSELLGGKPPNTDLSQMFAGFTLGVPGAQIAILDGSPLAIPVEPRGYLANSHLLSSSAAAYAYSPHRTGFNLSILESLLQGDFVEETPETDEYTDQTAPFVP